MRGSLDSVFGEVQVGEDLYRCPRCRSSLERRGERWQCQRSFDPHIFPEVQGIPILLNEKKSVFRAKDFVDQKETYFSQENLERKRNHWIPTLSSNVQGEKALMRFRQELFLRSNRPLVLVIGGGILGHGMEILAEDPRIRLVETDVSLAPRTQVICDAHSLPFEKESFDGVVAQAVLEHVVDPYACVEECCRVLKGSGLVYAETPFMQQVHGGRYDFTRFTHLGHRRLFRKFEEIDSGAVCGPGMALGWAWEHFLTSFAEDSFWRKGLKLIGRCTGWMWKYFDPYLVKKKGTLDTASGFYFIGQKSEKILSDRELILQYRGLV